MKKILFVFGTRPEAIKMAPLIAAFRRTGRYNVVICVTRQHHELLDQPLAFFGLTPDFDLKVMTPQQTLASLTAACITGLDSVILKSEPDLVLVQGDTTTAFLGALAAFYNKVPVAHIEAGLRSGERYSPFPEEVNRMLAGRLSELHFAPTDAAKAALIAENIPPEKIWVVGNTVIDALFLGLKLIETQGEGEYEARFKALGVPLDLEIVLITGHRRESFGGPFGSICEAIRQLAEQFQNVHFVYPVHLNPNVHGPVYRILDGLSNVHLLPPLPYPDMIYLMTKCRLVLTDSGGIQEEAPSLGKPVLVMRDVTERAEGVAAGVALLVGTDGTTIVNAVSSLLTDPARYNQMAGAINPYGNGTASVQIVSVVDDFFSSSEG